MVLHLDHLSVVLPPRSVLRTALSEMPHPWEVPIAPDPCANAGEIGIEIAATESLLVTDRSRGVSMIRGITYREISILAVQERLPAMARPRQVPNTPRVYLWLLLRLVRPTR